MNIKLCGAGHFGRNEILKQRGFTLVELLLSVFIITIGVLSILLFYTTSMKAAEYASDVTAATSHAEYIFEEMRTLPTLVAITGADWSQWAQDQGLMTLPSESASVSIVDSLADPLVIHATVSWTRHTKVNSVVLSTEMTK